jgi:hypothetical protein
MLVTALVRWNHNVASPVHLKVLLSYCRFIFSSLVIFTLPQHSDFGVTGLDLVLGSKRKCGTHFNSNEDDVELSVSFTRFVHLTPLKRLKECSGTRFGVWESHKATSKISSGNCEDTNLHSSGGCLQNSPCNAEDTLSKGFEGCISMKCL